MPFDVSSSRFFKGSTESSCFRKGNCPFLAKTFREFGNECPGRQERLASSRCQLRRHLCLRHRSAQAGTQLVGRRKLFPRTLNSFHNWGNSLAPARLPKED